MFAVPSYSRVVRSNFQSVCPSILNSLVEFLPVGLQQAASAQGWWPLHAFELKPVSIKLSRAYKGGIC